MSPTIASFFSSFVIYADAPSSDEEQPAKEADSEVVVEEANLKVAEKAATVVEEEPEEDEPEDVRVFNAHHSQLPFQNISFSILKGPSWHSRGM